MGNGRHRRRQAERVSSMSRAVTFSWCFVILGFELNGRLARRVCSFPKMIWYVLAVAVKKELKAGLDGLAIGKIEAGERGFVFYCKDVSQELDRLSSNWPLCCN